MNAVSDWLRSQYAQYYPREENPGDALAFAQHSREQIGASANLVFIAALLFSVVFWPTDLLVLRWLPEAAPAFHRWRIGVPLWSLLLLLGSPLPFPRARVLVGALGYGWIFGTATAHAGGLDRPFFNTLLIFALGSLTIPLGFWTRWIVTAMVLTTLLAGYLYTAPSQVHSPYLPFTVLSAFATVSVSALLGHSQHLLNRRVFLQEKALETYSQKLEELVRQRTEELRSLLSHLEHSREDERTNISRDLHDSLGQELAALRYALSLARQRYENDRNAIGGNLAELDHLLLQTAATTRTILHSLRPRVLDDMGLLAALQWLGENTEKRTGLPCKVDCTGNDKNVRPEVGNAIFRIVQEALTNVVKHAEAGQVNLRATIDEQGTLTLLCQDDGRGIEAKPGHQGMGMLSMRERAEALGGTFQFRTRPAFDGTELSFVIPAVFVKAPAAQP